MMCFLKVLNYMNKFREVNRNDKEKKRNNTISYSIYI